MTVEGSVSPTGIGTSASEARESSDVQNPPFSITRRQFIIGAGIAAAGVAGAAVVGGLNRPRVSRESFQASQAALSENSLPPMEGPAPDILPVVGGDLTEKNGQETQDVRKIEGEVYPMTLGELVERYGVDNGPLVYAMLAGINGVSELNMEVEHNSSWLIWRLNAHMQMLRKGLLLGGYYEVEPTVNATLLQLLIPFGRTKDYEEIRFIDVEALQLMTDDEMLMDFDSMVRDELENPRCRNRFLWTVPEDPAGMTNGEAYYYVNEDGSIVNYEIDSNLMVSPGCTLFEKALEDNFVFRDGVVIVGPNGEIDPIRRGKRESLKFYFTAQ